MNCIKTYLEESIKESSNIIYEKAHVLCGHGIMDDNCVWYHSVWQYLRLLGLVSSPTWHDSFYIESLKNNLKESNNILISGTADYSMLYYVIEVIKEEGVNANIYVLDTCKTPLYACEWLSKKLEYPINIVNEDILKYSNDNFFDIICTDAFLTRFDKVNAKKVVESWNKLLKNDGKVITTVRIHYKDEEKIDNETCIKEFLERTEDRYEQYKDYIKISKDKLLELTEEYARKMTSNNLGDSKEILSLFDNFDVNYKENTVSGELHRTDYLEIVASNNNV